MAPTPGVVLLAGPADWDSRFLYRTLREVAQLPVRGFARLEPDRWRSMADLSVVPAETVRQAARRADLLILMGPVGSLAEGDDRPRHLALARRLGLERHCRATGISLPADASPLAGAFLGQPVDSFPPAIQLTPMQPEPGDWMALTAQLGRRGAPRPAVFGSRGRAGAPRSRWRWTDCGAGPFAAARASRATARGSPRRRAGSWAAPTRLAGPRAAGPGGGRERRPVVFEWTGPGPPAPVAVAWSGDGGPPADTLRFDGSGRATVWLSPGSIGIG